ncbi:MAG TPA: helix-turn-helix transcriptional regulator [Thermoanaerobaculia bacterium]|nr:helix-turn-helix transcriptional regulator [Thermoanaerobaculia bacterium]
MRRKNPEDARIIGLALRRLRWDAGLTLTQLSEASRSTPSSLSRYEQGHQMPRLDTIRRIVASLDLTLADLYRAQQAVTYPPGRETGEEDGTLPPDTKAPLVSRKDALRLAQEAGKAVAHCCLAFMEIQAGGWEDARHGE